MPYEAVSDTGTITLQAAPDPGAGCEGQASHMPYFKLIL